MAMVPAAEPHDFNLLVSSSWRGLGAARREIRDLLRALGDGRPLVERTLAKGIIGVRTSLEPRAVIRELRAIFQQDPGRFQFTSRWAPVDLWTGSDLASLGQAVTRLRERIGKGESWRMTVEKRRYTHHHRIEIITTLARLIDERVDLTHPDKILKIDLIGDRAGLAVLRPDELFSVAAAPLDSPPGIVLGSRAWPSGSAGSTPTSSPR